MRRTAFLLAVTAMLLSPVTGVKAVEPYLEFREELKLSEQQISSLESILSSLKKAEIKAEASLRIAELELDELLKTEKVDLSKVKSKLQEVAKLQAELKFLHIKANEDAKQVLTQEQLKQFRASRRVEWERGERLHRRLKREIGARMRELEERQRDILEGLKRREETMMRELKELSRRIERDIEARMKKLKERQEEMLGKLRARGG